MKDFLTYENGRNKTHRALYQAILKIAFPKEETPALIVHHLTFTDGGKEPNEIPSADTLIFDHDIMGRVFGDDAIPVMIDCARVDCTKREKVLAEHLRQRYPDALPVALVA